MTSKRIVRLPCRVAVSAAAGLVLAVLGPLATPALAQAPGDPSLESRPDSGSLTRDATADDPAPRRSGTPIETPVPETDSTPPGGPAIAIDKVAFQGNSVFDGETLRPILGELRDQSFDLAGLQALADAVAAHYRDAGYPFVRAVLPPQDVSDGELTIQVIEGRYGTVSAAGDRDLAAAALPFLAPLQPGTVIAEPVLERVTLLLADLPGLETAPVLRPGAETGTGDLVVEVASGPRWSAAVSADNHGNRFSGAHRARTEFTANRLLTVGDQLALSALYTDEDLWLGSIDYSLPLGRSGLRGSANLNRSDYQLGEVFSGFTGTATVASLGLDFPIIRRQSHNLTVTADVSYKDLQDSLNGQTFDRKRAYTGTLALSFDRSDDFGDGGVSFGGLSVTGGTIRAETDGTAEGDFIKIQGRAARLQNLPDRFQLFGAMRFQLGRDLDGSESFSLGGANRVRSYPAGEASSSTGVMGRAELRYTFAGVEPYLLADIGHIAAENGSDARTLASAGIGLRASWQGLDADAALAWRLTGGDARSDLDQQNPRLWLSLSYSF